MKKIDSPVVEWMLENFAVDRKVKLAIYLQIVDALLQCIRVLQVPTNVFLPGSRTLSKALGVHRNTITAVYEELEAQGIVKIIPNKGVCTVAVGKKNKKRASGKGQIQERYFPKQPILKPFEEFENSEISLDEGRVDLRLVNKKKLANLYSSTIKKINFKEKSRFVTPHANMFFQKQLANYFSITRGFSADYEWYSSSDSNEKNLYILASLLMKSGDVVLVPELNNPSVNMIFQQLGAHVVQVPLTDDGLDLEFVKKHFLPHRITCMYIPSRVLYPTTRTWSVNQIKAWLSLAEVYDFYIIEDDAYFDEMFSTNVATTFKALDQVGQVIYLSTIGKHLMPSLQMGVVYANKDLTNEIRNYRRMLSSHRSVLEKQLMATLIYEGDLDKMNAKAMQVYKQRKSEAYEMIVAIFGEDLRVYRSSIGLGFWCEFNSKVSLLSWVQKAKELGVLIPRYLLYHTHRFYGFRLGYGAYESHEFRQLVVILKRAFDLVKDVR